MDRWILASTQTLIGFVRTEMAGMLLERCCCLAENLHFDPLLAAYRLYTVTPRLLELIDSLTNWYVRFNRKRLKGENGPDDAIQALNVLFEVLFTLSKLMVGGCRF